MGHVRRIRRPRCFQYCRSLSTDLIVWRPRNGTANSARVMLDFGSLHSPLLTSTSLALAALRASVMVLNVPADRWRPSGSRYRPMYRPSRSPG